MTSPIVALKEGIQNWLLADVSLMSMLREPKIFADIATHVAFPHIAFVAAEARENGTSSEDGHSIDLTLGVWSRHGGSAEGLVISSHVQHRLSSLPQALSGHHLVNLIIRSVEPVVQKDGQTWRTLLRIRAVTEVV